ncbi:hypothetical protein ACFXEZ_09865, partial [Streptomyces hygroscopicus]
PAGVRGRASSRGPPPPPARVAVAPYVIAPGRLPDRIARGAEAAGADLLAPVLGPAPELARLLLDRYDEARTAPPALLTA